MTRTPRISRLTAFLSMFLACLVLFAASESCGGFFGTGGGKEQDGDAANGDGAEGRGAGKTLSPLGEPTAFEEFRYSAPLLPLIPAIDPWVQLANRHAGERCLLVGNGPSLNKMPDFSFVRGFNVVMGMNKINMGFRRFNFRPNYFATHNAKVIEQMQDTLSQLHPDIVKFIRSDRWEAGREYNRLNNIVPTTSISVCGDDVCKFAVVAEEGGQRVVKYASEPDGKTCKEHCTNCFCRANERVVEGNTITYISLQVLFFMGCESVYLIGVDHNFLQTGQPNSAQLMEEDDPNHFDPGYFKGKMWDLADIASSERHYRIARLHYESNGRTIRDATVDGKLEVFDKASQEELYGLAPPPLSGANRPDIRCHDVQPRALDFVDPWLSRAAHDPVYGDFAKHNAEVLGRINQFNAAVCLQTAAWEMHPPSVSIVTAVRDSDDGFLDYMLDNAVSVTDFGRSEVIVVLLPDASFDVESAVYQRMRAHPNIVVVKLDGDPGLTDTWNFVIRFISRGKYATVWGTEDRKAPDSLSKRMEILDNHPQVDLVSAFVRVSEEANQEWADTEDSPVVKFIDSPKLLYEVSDMFRWVAEERCFAMHSPPRSSPVWRVSLHARVGWFDMGASPLSDWELWLRALINKSTFMHLREPLDLCFHNPGSSSEATPDGHKLAYASVLARFRSQLPEDVAEAARGDCFQS